MDLVSRHPASFRDPNGFIFQANHRLYRQVNQVYRPHYDRLMSSGLYAWLVQNKLLVAHREVELSAPAPETAYRVLEPETIPFVSYADEWCFSQLKDAALLTLSVQKAALGYGLTLMDASAYNVQFLRGRPLLIDTLSFEIYSEGEPWLAYAQFCRHFLAPLALMAYCDVRLGQLARVHIDGVPLDLTSRLLPARTRLNFGLLSHVHLHAAAQTRYAGRELPAQVNLARFSRAAHLGLIESLEATVRGLKWAPGGSEWAGYYQDTNYSPAAFAAKQSIVRDFLQAMAPSRVLDLGANTGVFSRIAAGLRASSLAADVDPDAVELHYLALKRELGQADEREAAERRLPLVLDLTNPSPAHGWENTERASFFERWSQGEAGGVVLALALVHHLAIANNLPLERLAEFFRRLGPRLIIEFVPKEDSQVQRLLSSRRDIFPGYHAAGFEAAFGKYFEIRARQTLPDSQRVVYWLEAGPEAR